MLNFSEEKKMTLTTQDVYDIFVFAQQAANDDFFNSFIFERAIWVYAAILFYQDRKEEISSMAANNILEAYYALLQDGTLEKISQDFAVDMNIITQLAENWYEEAAEHFCSPRALLSAFDKFSGNIMEEAMKNFKEAASDENVRAIEEFTKNWG